MKIKFLGTGAAEGFPAVFCSCQNCINARKLGEKEFRTRTQVLIDDALSIDFPPEAYAHSLRFGVDLSALQYVLVTHSHMDHFYAHDFILRGYKYARLNQDVLNIYGNSEVGKVFDECCRREMKAEVAPHLLFNEIKPYQNFHVGEYKVLTVPAQHSVSEQALLFYVEKGGRGYLHLHDTGRICDEAFEFLKYNGAKASAVCFDCTFLEGSQGAVSRHMGLPDNIAVREQLLSYGIIDENTQIILSHFSHNCNPTRAHLAEVESKYGFTAAYDGWETDI